MLPLYHQEQIHLLVEIGRDFPFTRDDLELADKALYFAKEHGRNRVEHFEAQQDTHELSVGRARQASDIELF